MKREPDAELALAQQLTDLEALSFVAHRDALAVLPVLDALGAAAQARWLSQVQALFVYDRDAGKAFIRGTPEAFAAFQGLVPWADTALLFCSSRGSARAVEAYMQALPRAAATGTAVSAWLAEGLAWTHRHAESGRAYFESDPAVLLADGVEGLARLLRPAEALYAAQRLALGRYLPGALRVRAMLGLEGLAVWARRGGDILQSGRLRGESFFALESEESQALLLEQLPGFRPLDHERLLALLTWVWLGIDLPLKPASWVPGDGRPFVDTDGRALFLPARLGSRKEALLAVWHASAHHRFGTYDQDHITELFRVCDAEHPPLDPDQAITWRPLFARYGEDLPRFQVLFDLCEDLRVDLRLAQFIPDYWTRLLAVPEAPSQSESVRPYRAFVIQLWKTQQAGQDLDARLRPLEDSTARPLHAWEAAQLLYASNEFPVLMPEERLDAYPAAHGPNAARPVYPRRTDTTVPKAPDLDPSTEAGDRPSESEVQNPQDAQGSDPDLEIPPEDTQGAGGRVGVGLPQPAQVHGHGHGHELAQHGFAYPEWDYRERRYKPRWALVQERVLDERDDAEAARLLTAYAATLRRLKRAVGAQKPTRLAPLRRQMEGEELDPDALLQFVAERRAGLAPRAAVYRQRRPLKRALSALLLADLSTSIMQQLPDGGRIVDRIRAALLLFAESLEEVGDPYAIAGFASKYRDQVSYYRIKDFERRLDPAVRGTVGGLSGRLATRMGAAIRHAARQFPAQEGRRLLLLLSDGRPADYDDGGDVRYLEEDTRLAIKECVDQGVHPFCISLDPRGGDYLARIFGDGHFLVVDRLQQLPERLPEIYLRLRGG